MKIHPNKQAALDAVKEYRDTMNALSERLGVHEVCEDSCCAVYTSVCSAPSYEEVCAALDKLHITCESAEPDVYRWYLRQPQASRARAKAIDVLNRLWQSQNVQIQPANPKP